MGTRTKIQPVKARLHSTPLDPPEFITPDISNTNKRVIIEIILEIIMRLLFFVIPVKTGRAAKIAPAANNIRNMGVNISGVPVSTMVFAIEKLADLLSPKTEAVPVM